MDHQQLVLEVLVVEVLVVFQVMVTQEQPILAVVEVVAEVLLVVV